ncbi:NAD-dependent epimerase/dehydratase family protein [Weissella muntiaci]|uniref:NAD-dependent epimerase/dehydratase family protein n=1 Tax=Weissella muntiaci TaxID=2508881 RepID=A0A6C2C519_9LACO|nr:NAD(P)H-binding protein [Weissella muntiaci]TYC48739.1 NAD-dependent epimerase/dehydratase family protein [Weissella muntiaci]
MKIMMIGTTGTVGGEVRRTLLERTDYELVHYSRHANQLNDLQRRETAITGDITDQASLTAALRGVDLVFASLAGDLPKMITTLVKSMRLAGVGRIIFISSMGIYNEIPAEIGLNGNLVYNSGLSKYRISADIVENSGLTYTVIRPGWFDRGSGEYEITRKGMPFAGHNVSVAAIADLVEKVINQEIDGTNQSLGINRPE